MFGVNSEGVTGNMEQHLADSAQGSGVAPLEHRDERLAAGGYGGSHILRSLSSEILAQALRNASPSRLTTNWVKPPWPL